MWWISQNCISDQEWLFKAESTSPESRQSRASLRKGGQRQWWG